MTRLYLFFILMVTVAIPYSAFSQQNEAAVYQENASLVEGDSIAFGEALVKLAWENYPENKAYRLDVLRETEKVSQVRWDWLNDLGASFNINEGNINSEANPNVFFPRYNFRFSMSVGTIVNTPSKIRQAKLGKSIAQENVDQQSLLIRREVLSRYYTYLFNINLLQLKLQSYQDVYSSYTSATQAFRRGEISIDDYNNALIAKDSAQEAKFLAERELMLSRLLLEEIIGMPLERAKIMIRNQPN